MSKRRTPIWLVLILVPVGLLLMIPFVWVFVSLTATPLHPTSESVPAVSDSAPLPKWAGAAEQARRIARESVAAQNLPGLSVAVGVDGGGVVWAEGFGFADLRTSTPVTPQHRFRIGTVSTALTSAAAGLLLENARLKLDDEIQTYVPGFPKKPQPVTLRQLMGHTPGVKPQNGNEAPLFREHCERAAEVLEHFSGNWQLSGPVNEYHYSIYDWILVSAAIEAAASKPFLAFMRERIFDPLGMRDTAADPGPDPVEVEGEDFPLFMMIRELIHDPGATRDTAAGAAKKPGATNKPVAGQVTAYYTRFAQDPNYGMHVMRLIDFSCYAGSAVFVSTPSDLVRFGLALNSGKLLKPSTVELLQTSQPLPSGGNTGYGLGWYVRTATLAGKQTRVVGYDGDAPRGRVASLMTFPEYGIVVAVMSNIPFADTSSVANRIAQIFAAQGSSPPHK